MNLAAPTNFQFASDAAIFTLSFLLTFIMNTFLKLLRGQLVFRIFVRKWSFGILFLNSRKERPPALYVALYLININTSASGYLLRSTSLTTLNSLRVISFEDQKSWSNMADTSYSMVPYLSLYDEGNNDGSVKEKWKMCRPCESHSPPSATEANR